MPPSLHLKSPRKTAPFLPEPGPLWGSLAIRRGASALGRGRMQQMPKLPLCLDKRIWQPQMEHIIHIIYVYINTYTVCVLTNMH